MISDDWYDAFKKSNVHLETDLIQSFTDKGPVVAKMPKKECCGDDLKTESNDEFPKQREIELDGVIMCTGYDSNRFLCTFDIFGLHGKEGVHLQQDVWKQINPSTYKGQFLHFEILLVMGN